MTDSAPFCQQAGENNENYVAPMTPRSCRWNSQGRKECTEEPKSSSLDSDDSWDSSVCPDGETCARNCAAGAVDQETWEGTSGVKQNGNGVDVGFVTQGAYSVNVGSRSYLMEDDKEYKLFNMLQKEISFDVDPEECAMREQCRHLLLRYGEDRQHGRDQQGRCPIRNRLL